MPGDRIEDHVLAKIALEKGFFTGEDLREAYRELGARMAAGQVEDPSNALIPILIERGLVTQKQIQDTMRIARLLMQQARPAGSKPAAPPPAPARPAPRLNVPPKAAPRPEEDEEDNQTLDLPDNVERKGGFTAEDIALAEDQTLIETRPTKPGPGAPPRPAAKAAPAPAPKPAAPKVPTGPSAAASRTAQFMAVRPAQTPPEVLEAEKDADYVFDDFVLVTELGKGGMGIVWKAWQKSLGRWVAVKFLNSSDETELKRFFQEAKTVLQLDHPNIARLFKLGKYEQMYYLVMEFVSGEALQHRLGQLDVKTCATAIRDTALALQSAHDLKIIHRDLKPQNLMLTPEGHVYVMDFGLARAASAESRHTVTGMVLGTPSFMSPEQAEGKFKLVDARSDVCSLGATLYALLAGRPPYAGRTIMDTLYKVVHTSPVPISHFNAHVPEELEKVVRTAMEKDPTRRYQSAKEMAEDLDRYLNGEPVKGRPAPGKVSPLRRPGIRR